MAILKGREGLTREGAGISIVAREGKGEPKHHSPPPPNKQAWVSISPSGGKFEVLLKCGHPRVCGSADHVGRE